MRLKQPKYTILPDGTRVVTTSDKYEGWYPRKGKWSNSHSLKQRETIRLRKIKQKVLEDNQTNSIHELEEICKFNSNLRRK